MKNFVQSGNVLDLTAPTGGVSSGEGHLFGALFGVAATNAAEGAKVAVAVEGVFVLPKATDAGIDEGATVYWDATAKAATTTATDNTKIGHATAAAAITATAVNVRLAA